MTRVVIADDEPLVREALRTVLQMRPDVRLVAEAADGPSALAAIVRERPDVAFLDLHMPGLGGLEIARSVASSVIVSPAVVFVTAHEQHAVAAFDLQVVDYVLKPFAAERVLTALERALQRRNAVRSPRPYIERFAVTSVGRVRIVPVAEVEWLQADDNYVRLHTTAREQGGLIRDTLKALESALDPAYFVRVHRSAIIRLDRLRELRTVPGGEVEAVLMSGTRVPIGRVYRDALHERLR